MTIIKFTVNVFNLLTLVGRCKGPSQFQYLISLSPPFSGEAFREEFPTVPLRDSWAAGLVATHS